MKIVEEFVSDPLKHSDDWVELVFDEKRSLQLKIEGLNASGSIKHKTAEGLILDAFLSGRLVRGGRVIESSSGSLGCAVASIAARLGISFLCVTDPNASFAAVRFMEACGAKVLVVQKQDRNGGYLGTRLEVIERLLKEDSGLVWLNQYQNEANPLAHTVSTGREIAAEFPELDVLYLGAGTTGTLMGCLYHFQQSACFPRIIAVDTEGSSTFGYSSGKRTIPGLGTSVTPKILNRSLVGNIAISSETSAIAVCRAVAQQTGLVLGGSSGSVIAAFIRNEFGVSDDSMVAAVSPDMGERYLETIYSNEWVNANFELGQIVEEQKSIKVRLVPRKKEGLL